ncbi:MAG: hypothetical protein JWQ97_3388 [Phenylobacterium sp.]|nr:hypothetical protein [Phenylobacterium sp.]
MKCPYCNGTGELTAHCPGPLIKATRETLGLTQLELSAAVGLSRAQIANIEAGRSDIPTKTLIAFANAMGVKPGEILP